MSYEKEINQLHKLGYVILKASRTTNAPIGWKRSNGRWGYTEEMNDTALTMYHSTFNASLLAKSHCGFYLGHNGLCCIDLDTKKLDVPSTAESLRNRLVEKLGAKVVVEKTKSNGWHIYFRYPERLDNVPDWTGTKAGNWIELYYHKRFIACYLSNSKRYALEHGNLLTLNELTFGEHKNLLKLLQPFKGKKQKSIAHKPKTHDVDKETWEQAESYVKQLEEKGTDITGDNPTWFRIGKAFASAFGTKGFDIFNRLSQFSPTYNEDTIAETYERFVQDDSRPRDKKVSIASFFKICNDAGLVDLHTLAIVPLSSASKEFELFISKKESMAEKCHTVVTEFLKHAQICCIDNATFYMFEHTHWVKRNARHIIELINSFVSRSTVDLRYIKTLQTVPYLELMLRELRLITQRDAIEPYTGDLKEGIFINMENGILHINMQTGKRRLLDHNATYNFTTILPYCYLPTATCTKFDTWMKAQIPDESLHEIYYAFVASCLTKHKADIIMMLAGGTSTGKSSLIEVTKRIIGNENSAAISASILFGGTPEAGTQAMQMENKLLAYDFDAQPFRHLEMLLKVAAQEPLPGWQMHIARRPVINYGRLIIAMNPSNYSVFNEAVARRFVTIGMDVKVEKDNNVMPAIYEELDGIFNNVLNVGLKHLLKHNGQIKANDKVKLATLKFHMNGRDSVRWFDENFVQLKASKDLSNRHTMEEKLRQANPNTTIIQTTISAMYQDFRTWMEDVEGYAMHKIPIRKYFMADLKLYGVEESVLKVNGTPIRGLFLGKKNGKN